MSSLYPEMRFSWEIKSVDALFCNGLARVGDLSKEAILQAIKDGDLRFLQVSHFSPDKLYIRFVYQSLNLHRSLKESIKRNINPMKHPIYLNI